MSQRIRVDTESLKRNARTNKQISGDIKKVGDKIYQSTYRLNDYNGQLPTKKTALTAQNEASGISSQVKESSEKLANIAAKFEEVDNALVSSFVAIPEPPLPIIFGNHFPCPSNLLLHTSQCVYKFVWFHEDVVKDSYPVYDNDGACNCTEGIGHLRHTGPCEQWEKDLTPMTRAQAEAQFKKDIKKCEDYIKSVVTVPLTQAQFDALVCFVFNLGEIPLDVLQALNVGNYDKASELMEECHHAENASGELFDVEFLKTRRANERNLFDNGLYGNESCDTPIGKFENQHAPSPIEGVK
jgi:lysozyme